MTIRLDGPKLRVADVVWYLKAPSHPRGFRFLQTSLPSCPIPRNFATMYGVLTFQGRLRMNRELFLKIGLTVVGLLFLATAYPMILFARQEPALSMMLSLYVTLGIFLLVAVRNPAAHRSLIAFTAWSSFAHAGLMGTQALLHMVAPREMIGVGFFALIGVALLALAPARQGAV